MINHKRFIGIIVSTLLTMAYSCTKSDTPNEDIYIDSKIIEGSWIGDISPDSMIFEFSEGKCKYEYYAYVSIEKGKDTLKLENSIYSDYKLTDSTIVFLNRPNETFKYKLSQNNPDLFYINIPYPWVELNRVKGNTR